MDVLVVHSQGLIRKRTVLVEFPRDVCHEEVAPPLNYIAKSPLADNVRMGTICSIVEVERLCVRLYV